MAADDNTFPFSRKVWNDEIIKPINSLCENPPDGCDEIDTLDEAEKDHIWTKKDVQDVHDKLIEICEDNEFDDLETPQLNLKTLIEDILEAIQEGWCHCKPVNIELGTYFSQIFFYTENSVDCCDITKEINAGHIFCRYTVFRTYIAPYIDIWVQDDSVPGLVSERSESYNKANDNSREWASNRAEELTAERFAKQLRTDLSNAEEALQNAQNVLSACTINCEDEQAAVDHWQSQVSEIEELLDEQEEIRDEAKEKAEDNLVKADEGATRQWEIMSNHPYLAASRSTGGVKKYAMDFMPGTVDLLSVASPSSAAWGVGPYPFDWTQAYELVYYERQVRGFHRDRQGYFRTRFTPNGLPYGGPPNRKYWIDVPIHGYDQVSDYSGYVSPPCPTPSDDDGEHRFGHSLWDTWGVGSWVKFDKKIRGGTRQMEYDDL
jgi:hypothetical protein